MRRLHTLLAILMGLVLLYVLALGTRRAVMEAQYRALGADVPFTLESALFFRRVKMVHDTGRLPAVDVLVQYPEGIDPARTYTLGAEYLLASGARLLPESMPFAQRLRWLESAWFCLGIPLMALWLRGWRRSWWAGGVAAAFYAVSIASVLRSTGHELSHENFALPVLIAHFAAAAWVHRARRPWIMALGRIASGSLLALALCSWDLIQYVVLLRAIWMGWRVVAGRTSLRDPVFQSWMVEVAALAVVGLASPYFRSHGWLLSPAMLLAWAGLAIAFLRASRRPRLLRWCAPGWRSVGVGAGLFLLGLLLARMTHYGLSYGHFGELLWAKVRWLNQKPSDPALLTFEQRILWVPALNSTTPALLRLLFPAILYLTIPAFLLAFIEYRRRADEKLGELLFSFGASIVTFWFFARFHVFLSLFASVLVGAWVAAWGGYHRWIRWLAAAAVTVGLSVEALHTLQRPGRWQRVNVYYKEIEELSGWLRAEAAPDPVLANFGVSGSIATYGKCAILLHPKFEDPVIRQRVKEYGEQLFTGTEKSFRDWADALGARYYVHALGEFARESPELQMRYFVNAMEPPPEVPARLFEAGRQDLRYFRYRWGNRKYAVYRILTGEDELLAGRALARAERFFESGDLERARQEGEQALGLDPGLTRAAEILGHAAALQQAGFPARPAGD